MPLTTGPQRAGAHGSRRGVLGLLVASVALTASALLAGCGSAPVAPAARPSTPASARLEITNTTDHVWEVKLATAEGTEVGRTRVAARGQATLSVPGGVYVVTQSVLASSGRPGGSRSFPAELEPGEVYRWPLATLLAPAATAPARR